MTDNFHPSIRQLFSNLILDPENFYPHQSNNTLEAYSLCVPLTIALSLLIKLEGHTASSLTKEKIKNALNTFSFQSVLNPDNGISLSSFSQIETLNTPFTQYHTDQYARLSQFQGLSLNLFYGKIHQSPQNRPKNTLNSTKSTNTLQMFLFPKYLSRHHDNPNFFQIDMLLSDPNFYLPEKKHQSQPKPKRFHLNKHVLAIVNLPLLVARRRNAATRNHARRYTEVCRKCLTLYKSSLELSEHKTQCQAYSSARAMQPRRCRNQIIYKPYIYNKYTKKVEVNYLKFKTGHLYRTLKPLFTTYIDFENLRTDIVPEEATKSEHPSNARSESTPFAFSLVHSSNYIEIPTPPYLKTPRTYFYNPEHESEDVFYIKLLTVLRDDLLLLETFLNDTLEMDNGPPTYKNMPFEQREKFFDSTNCFICGRKYDSFCIHQGKMKKVKKTRHHCHYLSFLNNVQDVCSVCNLHLQSEIAKKTFLTIFAHFASKFDGLIMALGWIYFTFIFRAEKKKKSKSKDKSKSKNKRKTKSKTKRVGAK